jgi:hypothetical protein
MPDTPESRLTAFRLQQGAPPVKPSRPPAEVAMSPEEADSLAKINKLTSWSAYVTRYREIRDFRAQHPWSPEDPAPPAEEPSDAQPAG